jgi:hypothetical protein
MKLQGAIFNKYKFIPTYASVLVAMNMYFLMIMHGVSNIKCDIQLIF